MPAGRPPKPIEVKRRNGNPGRRPLPDKAKALAIIPTTGWPAPITLGPAGRTVWLRAAEQASWLTDMDLVALEDYANTWDEIVAFRQIIAEDGLTQEEPIVTPAGHVVGTKKVAHPLLKELRAAQKLAEGTGSNLGFNPTARSRLGLEAVKVRSKLEELAAARSAR
jgi:P27 family predicted phage terminase small subunit